MSDNKIVVGLDVKTDQILKLQNEMGKTLTGIENMSSKAAATMDRSILKSIDSLTRALGGVEDKLSRINNMFGQVSKSAEGLGRAGQGLYTASGRFEPFQTNLGGGAGIPAAGGGGGGGGNNPPPSWSSLFTGRGLISNALSALGPQGALIGAVGGAVLSAPGALAGYYQQQASADISRIQADTYGVNSGAAGNPMETIYRAATQQNSARNTGQAIKATLMAYLTNPWNAADKAQQAYSQEEIAQIQETAAKNPQYDEAMRRRVGMAMSQSSIERAYGLSGTVGMRSAGNTFGESRSMELMNRYRQAGVKFNNTPEDRAGFNRNFYSENMGIGALSQNALSRTGTSLTEREQNNIEHIMSNYGFSSGTADQALIERLSAITVNQVNTSGLKPEQGEEAAFAARNFGRANYLRTGLGYSDTQAAALTEQAQGMNQRFGGSIAGQLQAEYMLNNLGVKDPRAKMALKALNISSLPPEEARKLLSKYGGVNVDAKQVAAAQDKYGYAATAANVAGDDEIGRIIATGSKTGADALLATRNANINFADITGDQSKGKALTTAEKLIAAKKPAEDEIVNGLRGAAVDFEKAIKASAIEFAAELKRQTNDIAKAISRSGTTPPQRQGGK